MSTTTPTMKADSIKNLYELTHTKRDENPQISQTCPELAEG
jgi:hypothetical protein